MRVLAGLEPERVFYFFEEICKIPHGSGNVEQISDYLAEFAKERNLEVIQDSLKNIIIIKEAAPGYETEPAVILQGHMDMVAVKTPQSLIDMKTEGLSLVVEGDEISARDTSLGGDDGIAVAYALALLDAENLSHPRLEVVLTVDEEVGMDGAREIDLSMLTGKRMLNLDSEEEGIFLTSCAGGARFKSFLPVSVCKKEGVVYRISIEGLQGGHSGAEIHKERGNANCILGRVLYRLTGKMPVWLKSLEGGLADNAIPRQSVAVLLVEKEKEVLLREELLQAEDEIRKELTTRDPNFQITAVCMGEDTAVCMEEESTAQAALYLMSLPNGVQAMSADVPGLVETSLNLGIMQYETGAEEINFVFSVRSCVESAKQELLQKLGAVTELAGGSFVVEGEYPGWAYRVDSPMREKIVSLYEEMYGTKPKLEAIHAGLECGILAGKIENLDCISFGPDMKNIHTTEETLSIASARRVWEFLVRLLAVKG